MASKPTILGFGLPRTKDVLALIKGFNKNGDEVMRGSVYSYSRGSKELHWIVAIIVLLMLSFSFFLDDLPDQYQSTAYLIHKSLGLTVLFLMCARLFWIVHTGKPALPYSVPYWERALSHVVHVFLYVLLIAMPFSGWIMSVAADRVPSFFGLLRMPLYGIPVNKTLSSFMSTTHKTIAWMLIVLIALHIAGALKHYFINKDKILHRMLTDSRKDF